jgi:hypothetical protein
MRNWSETRDVEYERINNLLQLDTPLVHVIGPHGAGKTSLLTDIVRDTHHVFVDANTCGSVPGIMSCILRRLSVVNLKSKKEGPSPDSDLDFKPEAGISLKCEVSTPEDASVDGVTRELLSSPRVYATRKCAVIAKERLAASVRGRTNTVTKRRLLDDLIDEDDSSDSDATEGESSSSEDEEDEWRKRYQRVKNSKVSLDNLRILYRAQNMAVKSPSAFVQKLERVVARIPEEIGRVTIIIDNIDSILTSDDYDLDAQGAKTSGSDFLRLLSRLSEYISTRTKLNVVLISSRHIPHDVSGRCVTVHLREYSADACKQIILNENPEFESWFLNTGIAILYPVFSGNLGLLRDALHRVREDPQLGIVNSAALVSTTKVICGKEMRRLFGGVEDDSNAEQQLRDLETARQGTRWLSKTEKQVLLAGYLAAHNPPNCDKIIFRTIGSHGGPVGRKKTISSNAFRRGKLNADSINVRAPVPFILHRLLTIYRYLSNQWEDPGDSGVLFHKSVRVLIQHGLFKSPASEDWLRGGTKLNCHAPHDLIEVVASGLNVKLDEVIYG